MGGKSKSKKNKKPSAREAQTITQDDVHEIDASDLDELPPSADGPFDPTANADDITAATDPAKTKSFKSQIHDRMKRAILGNNLTARCIVVNAKGLGYDDKTAAKLAAQIEEHTTEIHVLIESFLAHIPDDYAGVTPSLRGPGAEQRKGFIKGGKVHLKPDVIKSFSNLFAPEELADLTVENVSGKMIRLVTTAKATLVVNTKQVEANETKAAA